MKMTFRWYGSQSDPIPLKYIKQIPGMTGLMGLLEKPAGVDWPEDEFIALKKEVNEAGLEIEVIESVNVHEDIKTGLGRRDEYIANYISTIRMLAKHGVKVIIYNFMHGRRQQGLFPSRLGTGTPRPAGNYPEAV